MNAKLTEYDEYCAICSNRMTELHHLCYGTANRKISTKFGLTMPLCDKCHKFIHKYPEAGVMSKIIGQLLYERNYLAQTQDDIDDANGSFRIYFGASFL